MAGESHTTTDHKTIQEWTEVRGGKPATVKRTGDDENPGVLRINFPGGAEDSLEDISWEAFFEKFEESNLAFLYQEQTAGGEESRFFKLVSREGKADEGKSKSNGKSKAKPNDKPKAKKAKADDKKEDKPKKAKKNEGKKDDK